MFFDINIYFVDNKLKLVIYHISLLMFCKVENTKRFINSHYERVDNAFIHKIERLEKKIKELKKAQ